MTLKTGLAIMGSAAGICLAISKMRKRPGLNLQGKVVLITGGSRGLGLAMAREFGLQGATVAICARNQAELELAHDDLISRGILSRWFVCDITLKDQVDRTIAAVEAELGPIEILVNNAGVIKVGPFSEMDTRDFDEAMNVMFRGALYNTLAVVPGMSQRRRGTIVNITSIGGRVSVPHLLPYSCAKFATVALSEGLRNELAPAGIRVTTIMPGLLRTGSHLNARFKGKQADEYAWFAAGAATPLISISAERAARSIVRAACRGDREKILSVPASVLAKMQGVAPGLTSDLLSIVAGALPAGNDGSRSSRTGSDMEGKIKSWLWKAATFAGQRAATSLNEIPSRGAGGMA